MMDMGQSASLPRFQGTETLRQSEARLRGVVANLRAIVRVIGRDGTYLLSEGRGLETIGRAPDDLVGQSIYDIQRNRPDILDDIRRALAGEELHTIRELNGVHWETQYSPLYENGVLTGTVYVAMDVSERIRAQEALRESEARLKDFLDNATELIQIVDAAGRFLYVNRAWRIALGYAEDDLTALHMYDIVAPEERMHTQALFARILAGEVIETVETVIVSREGRQIAVSGHVSRRIEAGQAPVLRGIFRDVSRQRELEAQLLWQARHDALTGLMNRGYFLEYLDQALDRVNASQGRLAVLFLDLDTFKSVNDRLGHAAGDAVLRSTAKRLRECVRPQDVIGRFGGDEFTVLMEGIDDEGSAVRIAERLIAALAMPISLEANTVRLTVSVGIALSGAVGTRAVELLGAADLAMYEAKRDRTGRYAIAAP